VDARNGLQIFSSLLAGLVFSTGVSAQEIKPKHVEIVAFGASQTAGKGVSETEAYPARVEALLRADGFDVSVANQGVNADTVTDQLRRIESAIPPSTRMVLFQPGTNDCARRNRIGESDFTAVLDRTMAWMKARHFQVIVLNSNCYHDATQTLIGKYGFVDYGNVLQGGLDEFKSDGQHLTPEGYQKLATFLLPSIEKLLKDDIAAAPSNGS
jgi:acyl-CoA thioesterase-1